MVSTGEGPNKSHSSSEEHSDLAAARVLLSELESGEADLAEIAIVDLFELAGQFGKFGCFREKEQVLTELVLNHPEVTDPDHQRVKIFLADNLRRQGKINEALHELMAITPSDIPEIQYEYLHAISWAHAYDVVVNNNSSAIVYALGYASDLVTLAYTDGGFAVDEIAYAVEGFAYIKDIARKYDTEAYGALELLSKLSIAMSDGSATDRSNAMLACLHGRYAFASGEYAAAFAHYDRFKELAISDYQRLEAGIYLLEVMAASDEVYDRSRVGPEIEFVVSGLRDYPQLLIFHGKRLNQLRTAYPKLELLFD